MRAEAGERGVCLHMRVFFLDLKALWIITAAQTEF